MEEVIKKLTEECEKLQNEIKNLKETIQNKELIIQQLQRYIFGSKKEKLPIKDENIIDGEQMSLLVEDETEEIKKEVAEKTEEITYHRKKKNCTSGIKKTELKNVEQIEVIENADDAKCPECGSDMEKIGKEFVRSEIEYVPAQLKIVNYYRNVYKCTKCGTAESEKETPTIVKTHTPAALLTHSFASPSLATAVIYQKYYMGVPLYRQEKSWDDIGLVLPRNVSANWCIKISEYYLEILWRLMISKLKANCEVLNCDETTIQCNHEAGRNASSNSYMWVLVSGKDEPCQGVVFKYSQSRSEMVAKDLLRDYKKILVTDGYAGYNNVPDIIHAECWAHARRKFYESIPQNDTTSCGYIACEQIDLMFKIEKEIESLSDDEKLKIRQEKTEPILKKFYEWVYSTSEKYIANKKLRDALTYAINQKEELCKFIKNGKIPMTNSKAERAIRPFAVHRKNWLFADTVAGAKANAVYYSLIESAKVNKLNIFKYINYLLEELSQLDGEYDEKDLEKYLPWSDKLPLEIRNFEGDYKELDVV